MKPSQNERVQPRRGEGQVADIVPDLTNADELQKAIVASELLNRKY